MTVVRCYFPRMEKQKIAVVRLKPLDFSPMAGRIVIRKCHEIEIGLPRRIEHAVERKFHLALRRDLPCRRCGRSGNGSRRQTSRNLADHGKRWFFTIQLFDVDGIGIVASFSNVRDSQDHGPTARLDRSRQIAIAGERWADGYLLRPAAAPSTKSFRPAQSEVEDRPPLFTGIRQRNTQAFRSRCYDKLTLEQAFVVRMGQ